MKASDTKTFVKVEQHLRKMTEDYLALGVAVIRDSWSHTPDGDTWTDKVREYKKEYLAVTSDTFTRSYLRAVGKELKRAFVVATVHPKRVELIIPRQKRMEPLFASYLLAPDASGMRRDKFQETPLYFRGRATLVTVTFNGDEGRAMFDAFIERCRTEPDYKKALRTA